MRIVDSIKKLIPYPLKLLLSSFRLIVYKYRFIVKYGFWPPPTGTDLVGYEILIDEIRKHKINYIEGDFVEIGSFMGGGTYKLSKYLSKQKSQKRLFTVDIFDFRADNIQNTQKQTMSEIYSNVLKGRDQYKVFCDVTQGCDNICVIKGDSKKIKLPTEKIAFGFIDGNHEPSYVVNDFYLIWPKLSGEGIVAFDDYGYDLPMVTKTIDDLINRHQQEIKGIWVRGKVIYLKKRKR